MKIKDILPNINSTQIQNDIRINLDNYINEIKKKMIIVLYINFKKMIFNLVLICFYGKINLGISFGFIFIYVIYVGLAIYQDRKHRIPFSVLEQNINFNKIEDIKNTDIDLDNNAIELITGSSYSSIGGKKKKKIILSKEGINDNITNKLEGISTDKNEEREEVSIDSEISTNTSNNSEIEKSIIAVQIGNDIKDNIKEQILL